MYIQSPTQIPGHVNNGVFIAGGISNCPNWQDEIVPLIKDKTLTIFNPRRIGDLAKEGTDAEKQIKWEYSALKRSVIMLFWFPKESICPITLFEYGKALVWLGDSKIEKLIVGHDPEYPRVFDLNMQTNLVKVNELSYDRDLVYCHNFEDFKSAIKMELGNE